MSKTILIVEDNALNRRLINDVLQAADYRTVEAATGAEALAVARQRRPDLVLMDIRLPDMSGLEVARRLKSDDSFRGVPVVAVTALALDGDEQEVLAGGCDGYIEKPFSTRTLLETVARCLK